MSRDLRLLPRLTPEQEALVTNHTRFAEWIADRVHIRGSLLGSQEEARSEAMVGLILAAHTWDPDGGSAFTTWAAMKVRNHLRDYLREIDHLNRRDRAAAKAAYAADGYEPQRLRQATSLDGIVEAVSQRGESRNSAHALYGIHVDDETWIDDDQDRAVIRAFLTHCQDQPWFKGHLPYVAHRRIAGATLATVADEIGLTESRVCQLWNRLLSEATRWADDNLTDLLDPQGART